MYSADGCEVAVIGGGVAGCAAALALATNGVRNVRIFEASRARAPRVGESIPPDTRTLLQRLGIWEQFLEQAHEKCLGSCSVWSSPEVGYNDFVLNPFGHGWHLDRDRFEGLLSKAAVKAGAGWRSGTRLTACARLSDGRFALSFRTAEGAGETLVARHVVDASGVGSSFARLVGARQLSLDRLFFVYGFFEFGAGSAYDSKSTRLESVRDGWWYLAALPGGRIAVALATDLEAIRARKLHLRDQWFASLLQTTHIASQLDGSRLVSQELAVRSAPSFRLDRAAGHSWYAAGDAASAYDPISSQGIHKALSDGIGAADAIASHTEAWVEFDLSIREAFEIYAANRNYLYGLENRWPDAPFWKTRRARTSVPN
jgi:flavin-dependent dehydrogenase